MRLMSKSKFLIVPRGTKFMGLGKLGFKVKNLRKDWTKANKFGKKKDWEGKEIGEKSTKGRKVPLGTGLVSA